MMAWIYNMPSSILQLLMFLLQKTSARLPNWKLCKLKPW